MPTYHQIQLKLQADDDLAVFLTRKELKDLPRILYKDEEIETIVYGHYRGCNGILILTNVRLVFADKGLHAFTTELVELSKVSSMTTDFVDKFGTISFVLPKKTVVFEYFDKPTYDKVTAWLKTKMASPQNIAVISKETSAEEEAVPQKNDVFAKLERLAGLKDKGIITEAEFAQQKKKLLSMDEEDDDDDDAF